MSNTGDPSQKCVSHWPRSTRYGTMGGVAHVRWQAVIPRLLIDDVRADGRFLRATLHKDAGVIVISHWQGDECLAATRIPIDAAPELIELLQDALATEED